LKKNLYLSRKKIKNLNLFPKKKFIFIKKKNKKFKFISGKKIYILILIKFKLDKSNNNYTDSPNRIFSPKIYYLTILSKYYIIKNNLG